MERVLPGFPERLKSLHEGESVASFAARIGESDTTLGNYERGTRVPKADFLARLKDATGVDLNWLLLGEALAPARAGQRGEISDGFSLVPRYSVNASAGTGLLALEEREADRLAFRTDWLRDMGLNPRNCGLVTAAGDSMVPTIPDRAILLVDLTIGQQLRSGCLYVVVLEGDLLVKRLIRRLDGTIELVSDNPLYPKEVIDAEQLDRLSIPGRVVWIGHAV